MTQIQEITGAQQVQILRSPKSGQKEDLDRNEGQKVEKEDHHTVSQQIRERKALKKVK